MLLARLALFGALTLAEQAEVRAGDDDSRHDHDLLVAMAEATAARMREPFYAEVQDAGATAGGVSAAAGAGLPNGVNGHTGAVVEARENGVRVDGNGVGHTHANEASELEREEAARMQLG